MKKTILKISFSLLCIGLTIGLYFMLKPHFPSGSITIIVEDKNEIVIIEDNVSYLENQTLKDIIDKKYVTEYNNTGLLVKIGTNDKSLEAKDIYSAYIAIYVNDEYANYGVDRLPLHDGDIIKFSYKICT